MHLIQNRIAQLREEMKAHNLDAYIIPGTDPHLSEYLPDYWQERAFISGFTGSAGKVVITLEKAALWTDSRYFMQAADQLKNTGIELMKMKMPQTPSIINWLNAELNKGAHVGINTLLISAADFKQDEAQLFTNGNITLENADLISIIWKNRPALSNNKIITIPSENCGEKALSKVQRLRVEMENLDADYYFIAALDEIAWMLNFRGSDIAYNPVCIAYLLVGKEDTTLFIDLNKVQENTLPAWIKCVDITNTQEHLRSLPVKKSVALDLNRINYALKEVLTNKLNLISVQSWPILQKAIKNNSEIEGFRKAMVKDGVALVHFYHWLENAIRSEEIITEYTIALQLRTFRQKEEGFMDESFATIAGYNKNGAIVHYSANKETASTLCSEGTLLLDSGGQYLTGTTDITRTTALGKVLPEVKRDYTLVLKGHLALSNIVFPENTRGSQLDVLARQFLWQDGLDYGHGTGHGVGHFLNVHEGPQSIRKEENPVTLQKGMVCSNEPGIYKANAYGIRIENLVLVQPKSETEFGTFYCFETLTLFPYDLSLIETSLLNANEIEQINAYHAKVYALLHPHLSPEHTLWLKQKTVPIQIS